GASGRRGSRRRQRPARGRGGEALRRAGTVRVSGFRHRGLLRALVKGDEAGRWEAAGKLSHVDDPKVVRKLQRLLQGNGSAEARGAAAYVLGFSGQEDV